MHRRLLIFNKSKCFPSMTKWQVNSRSVVLLLIKWATSWEIFCKCKAKGANQLRVTAVKTQLCIAFVFTTYINRILIWNLYNEFSANFIIEWSRVSFKCYYIAFKVCILKQYIFIMDVVITLFVPAESVIRNYLTLFLWITATSLC